jgi:uncharacterized protein DUF927
MSARQFKVKLTRKGVYHLKNDDRRVVRVKVAAPIRLMAIGVREADNVTVAQIRFRTMHGNSLSEWFEWSKLLPSNREQIIAGLADRGYEWPDDQNLSKAILRSLAKVRPKRRIRIVQAPGWHEPVFVRPHQVFAPSGSTIEMTIDPNTSAHLGAYVVGEGSLQDWKERIAEPSKKSSRLRLVIAAALAAPLLRPLDMDSFGLNLFSDTSDGKTHLLTVAASVDGLITDDGFPGWGDSETGLEDQAVGYRDGVFPLEETGAADRGPASLSEKARTLAFLVGRNRPRRLSKKYEFDNALTRREFRIIVLSSSERALGAIARSAGKGRLGGEEVRLTDVPAARPGSLGIFDGKIRPAPGKTPPETTKELVERMKVDARQYQGHAGPEFLRQYVNDPNATTTVRKYMERFEAEAKVLHLSNAHYRIRSNFALLYAAAALAIDYGILPWGKRATLRVIKRCMRDALVLLESSRLSLTSQPGAAKTSELVTALTRHLAASKLAPVTLKQRATATQVKRRREADGFLITGEIYLKPDRLKQWFPDQPTRAALIKWLKRKKILHTIRSDTSTCDQLIGGIDGKRRYYIMRRRRLWRRCKAE